MSGHNLMQELVKNNDGKTDSSCFELSHQACIKALSSKNENGKLEMIFSLIFILADTFLYHIIKGILKELKVNLRS